MLDPELGASIVELGMVGGITVDEGGHAVVRISLTTVGCPLRSQIERDVKEAALSLDEVTDIELVMGVLDASAKAALMKRARTIAQGRAPSTSIPLQTPVLMIASGKGGVGKSSITANLAVALAASGRTIGVLDADIWGFSLSRLLGIQGEVTASAGKMQPLERVIGSGSIRLLSMGLLADEDQALMWRGLIVQKAVAQFIEDAIADYTEFEAGTPVPIQIDDWAPANGIKLAFTPGNVDLTIPSGEVFAIPLENQELDLPTLGAVLISAGAQAILIQKKP